MFYCVNYIAILLNGHTGERIKLVFERFQNTDAPIKLDVNVETGNVLDLTSDVIIKVKCILMQLCYCYKCSH